MEYARKLEKIIDEKDNVISKLEKIIIKDQYCIDALCYSLLHNPETSYLFNNEMKHIKNKTLVPQTKELFLPDVYIKDVKDCLLHIFGKGYSEYIDSQINAQVKVLAPTISQ